ncbi:hypothetical protein KM043_007658 [Ampulex compressa]|nr:hypothetical protein KM043_007658 [Ampulex compressa]
MIKIERKSANHEVAHTSHVNHPCDFGLKQIKTFIGARLGEHQAAHLKKYAKKQDMQFNSDTGKFHCPNCNNGYGRRDTMLGHFRYECGKAPRYKCPYCALCSKKTSNIYQHIRCMHPKEQVTLVKLY